MIISIDIEKVKARKWEEIKRERDRRMNVGGYLAGGHWFHSDAASRTQQLGLVALGNNLPAGLTWKVLSNGLVTMTPSLAQAILAAAAENDNDIFVAALTHKAAMEASSNPATYDYSDGWPLMYQDTLVNS